MTMDRRQKEALDRHITGNYGEDQYPADAEADETAAERKFTQSIGQPDPVSALAKTPPPTPVLPEQKSKGEPGLMRVVVDGTTHPIHDGVPSLSAVVSDPEGHLAEIQIAALGNGELNVVIAGIYWRGEDPAGNLLLRVYPDNGDKTKKPRRTGR